ncbi:hypothetical protein PR048_006135 [Dryococelus australis]|uniref:DUF4371 domain-containing protein n=1 Tax=Dryococelus australis TaxID=614101 RepID=A0ABQ9IA50_9NEOP|nr:hypothetical protein PR048_006135 [Dryococelus australis]
MSCSKYRGVDTENRQFKTERTDQYRFSMVGVCNLKRHHESNHKKFHSKFPCDSSLRQRKINSMLLSHKQGSSMIRGGSSAQDKRTEASLRVSWILCRNIIPFTYAEVVKDCMLQSVKKKKKKKKPLSNDTTTRFCNEPANNISCNNCFSLTADKSTDMSDIAQLSVFVRFFNGERFLEELLELMPLYGGTIGFFFSKLLASKSVSNTNIVSVVTDGAPAMASEKEGLVGKLKQINSCIIPYQSIIHNTVLCAKLSKDPPPPLIIDNCKTRSALTHRNIKQFLNDFDSEFKDVLLYNNVCWLSKGQMLKRVWGLRKEIVIFLELMDTSEKRDNFLNLLRDLNQLARLSFFVDILPYLMQ